MANCIKDGIGAQTPPSLSIIIPVLNGGAAFRQCLSSLCHLACQVIEIIVVVDGGTDDSGQVAEEFGVKVIRLSTTGGPARARNIGAGAAQGDILFFVDADVTVHNDTIPQIVSFFQQNQDVAAIIGSYDDAPGATNFLSQYKNLFHHYTHQTACKEASTFWGACGAIRQSVFLAVGGFNEVYRYPSIEDIELGYRLKHSGHQIQLCKTIQVKHLKRWETFSLLRAEFFYRALPWTELIWRDRKVINDLNLDITNRTSVVLTYLLLITLAIGLWIPASYIAAIAIGIALIILNRAVYQFFANKRGLKFALRVIPWHWLYFFYCGLAFTIGTFRSLLLQSHLDKATSLQALKPIATSTILKEMD
jgi:glycosyltransferase involved in cell wall biosynthesis